MSAPSQRQKGESQTWVLDIYATFEGTRDDAEHVVDLIERLAQRRGCRDLNSGVYLAGRDDA